MQSGVPVLGFMGGYENNALDFLGGLVLAEADTSGFDRGTASIFGTTVDMPVAVWVETGVARDESLTDDSTIFAAVAAATSTSACDCFSALSATTAAVRGDVCG